MGSIFSSVLDDNMKKQQEFMLENQRVMLERQVQMQNIMRERMMAMQIAKAQELLNWTGGFGLLLTLALVTNWRKTKDPRFLLPIVPISFVLGYQTDLAYGNKIERMRRMADNMLDSRPELFILPKGPITFDEIERRRVQVKDEERFAPHQAFL